MGSKQYRREVVRKREREGERERNDVRKCIAVPK